MEHQDEQTQVKKVWPENNSGQLTKTLDKFNYTQEEYNIIMNKQVQQWNITLDSQWNITQVLAPNHKPSNIYKQLIELWLSQQNSLKI